MDRGTYEKVIIADPDFPVVVLENDKSSISRRQQLCPLHWHEHLELHYILEGTLDIRVNQQHTLYAGDLILINSNEPHSSCCSGRLRERILIFRLQDLSAHLAAPVPGFQRIISQDQQVMGLMNAFEEEYVRQQNGYQAACMGILLQLMVCLSRNFPLNAASNREYQKHSQLMQRFLPVQEYITLHYAEHIPTETLASLVYLSKDRFNHLFKECMGIPLRKYINDIRLHTAFGWLEAGQCSPAEAAVQAGFTDYNHFGRQFRQTFGCTPSQIMPKSSKIV